MPAEKKIDRCKQRNIRRKMKEEKNKIITIEQACHVCSMHVGCVCKRSHASAITCTSLSYTCASLSYAIYMCGTSCHSQRNYCTHAQEVDLRKILLGLKQPNSGRTSSGDGCEICSPGDIQLSRTVYANRTGSKISLYLDHTNTQTTSTNLSRKIIDQKLQQTIYTTY